MVRLVKFSVFLLTCFTQSIYSQWVFTGGPEGNLTLKLFSHGKYLLAGTKNGNGFYRTTDDGLNWESNLVPGTSFLAADFAALDPYIFTGGGGSDIFRSIDEGVSWTDVTVNSHLSNIISTITSLGTRLFAATYFEGVWVSTDYGATWSHIEILGYNPNRIYVVRTVGSFVFAAGLGDAGGYEGVNLSTDSGATWRVVNLSMVVKDFIGFSSNIFACGDSGVYRSGDVGKNWDRVNKGLPPSSFDHSFWNFAVSGMNLFVCSDSGVFRSTNDGESWVVVNQGLPDTTGVWCLTVHDGYLFAGTATGSYPDFGNHGAGVWRHPLSDFANAVSTTATVNSKFNILSNPTSSSADFQFDALKQLTVFELFDVLGRSVLRQQLAAGQASLHVNMQNMPAGMYFARLGGETVRFVKM